MTALDGNGCEPQGTTVLGIDTSTAATSVCVRRADGDTFEHVPDTAAMLGPPAHARELMPQVVRRLDAAGVGFGDLGAIAVGVGPGAYTGLRIGIATARALAQAHGLLVKPVASLDALAAGIAAVVALPLIDARRGEVFAALHVEGEERWEPFVARIDEVVARLSAAREEGLPPPLAAGDGSLRFRHALEAASIEVAPAESRRHVVRALHVCRLSDRVHALEPEAVLPRYLRDPDVTPQR